jgi:hypothetical protein
MYISIAHRHYKEKNLLQTLALEVETAMRKINITEQQYDLNCTSAFFSAVTFHLV